MSVAFVWVQGGGFTMMLKGKSFTVLPEHTNYRLIKEMLPSATEDELLGVVDVAKLAKTFSKGKVTIENGTVMFEGEAVHNSIAKRILQFMEEGLPFDPLVKFLENLMKNPSMQSQKELYDFLEHEHLPVTEDGYFLAYKAVRPDYMDKYRGVFRNKVGDVVEVARGKVDDDRNKGCSFGLHAGALEYVAGYGNPGTDHIMIVKINPADVVSVPHDCNHQKLRTCRYEVVGEYQGELKKPLYSSEYSYSDDEDEDVEDECDEEYWDQFEEDDEWTDEDEEDLNSGW